MAESYSADEEADIKSAEAADACARASASQANIADIHARDAEARGDAAGAAAAREKAELARREALEKNEEAERNREEAVEARQGFSRAREEADRYRTKVGEARTRVLEKPKSVADALYVLIFATMKDELDAADARAEAAKEHYQDARARSEAVDHGTATWWELWAESWGASAEMHDAKAEWWDASARISYERIQAAKTRAESTVALDERLKVDKKRAANFREFAADSHAEALYCRAEAVRLSSVRLLIHVKFFMGAVNLL